MQKEQPGPVRSSAQPRDFGTGVDPRSPQTPSGAVYAEHGPTIANSSAHEARLGLAPSIPSVGSVSPSDAPSTFSEYPRGPGLVYSSPYAGPPNAAMLLNPKRAYRQRRKDPSCDACRERKVKVHFPCAHNPGFTLTETSATQRIRPVAQSVRVVTYAANLPRTPIDACLLSSEPQFQNEKPP